METIKMICISIGVIAGGIKDFFWGLLKDKKTAGGTLMLLVAACTSGLIIPLLLILLVVAVGMGIFVLRDMKKDKAKQLAEQTEIAMKKMKCQKENKENHFND
jgi:hypothetical protein